MDKKTVSLSAIDPIFVSNIPVYKEEQVRNKPWVTYGKDNK